MTLSALAQQLERLASALIRLDHAAVESSGSQLEEIASELRSWRTVSGGSGSGPGEPISPVQWEQLRAQIRFCVVLNRQAERWYAGWSRLASLSGVAYSSTGSEPALQGLGSLAFKG